MTPPGPFLLRPARPDDGPAICDLHIESWQSAYRGQFPEDFLEVTVPAAMTAKWQTALLSRDPRDFVFVAEEPGGRLAGFVALANSADHPLCAYVDNLHIRPDRRGSGLGRRLLGRVADEAHATGRQALYLWVVATHLRALKFYRGLGGVAGETADHDLFGAPTPVTRMSWPRIEALVAATAD